MTLKRAMMLPLCLVRLFVFDNMIRFVIHHFTWLLELVFFYYTQCMTLLAVAASRQSCGAPSMPISPVHASDSNHGHGNVHAHAQGHGHDYQHAKAAIFPA
jgi:hypothetical protein